VKFMHRLWPRHLGCPQRKKIMETYNIVIHSVGCSGPGAEERWVAVLDDEELPRDKAPMYAAKLQRGLNDISVLSKSRYRPSLSRVGQSSGECRREGRKVFFANVL
jgi:hypothetical protein